MNVRDFCLLYARNGFEGNMVPRTNGTTARGFLEAANFAEPSLFLAGTEASCIRRCAYRTDSGLGEQHAKH